MIGVALKGLLGRKTRAVLTAMAIALGVAMVSGTFVLTDTLQKAFGEVFTTTFKDTSVIVSGKEIVKNAPTTPTVPAALLPKVRALPGVAAASGQLLFDQVKLIDASGKKLGGRHAPAFGFGLDPKEPRFNPITLASGSWASGRHQVVIDTRTASKHHYAVGDSIGAKADGPILHYTITGLGKLGGVSLGGATLAVFDVPTAQAILNRRDSFDAISVLAASGVSPNRLAAEVRPLLPRTVEVRSAERAAQAASEQVDSGIDQIRFFLLAFGGIALFVGAFVIFNTISITVAQRVRELATLRTLGASRRQVLGSVLLESGLIGALASLVGLFLGLALAEGLNAVFLAVGLDLPRTGAVLAGRTVLVCMLVGTVVTLVAGLFPALRATRVAPISAVREGAVLPRSRFAPYRPYFAAAVIALGLAAIAQGLFASHGAKAVLLPLGVGTLLLFLGVALISSQLVRPLAALVGWPARRVGGPVGRLAAENSVRNTGRTAATAAALMIGLALVTFVATVGSGLRVSVEDALDRQITADYVVAASGSANTGLFPAGAGNAVAAAPGVTVASSVRGDQARIFGKSVNVVGVDGATIGHVYRFAWKQGSDAVLPGLGNGVIVDTGYAKAHRLTIGSRLPLETSAGVRRTFVVKATYHPPQAEPLFTGIVISKTAFDRTFPRPGNALTLIDVRGGATSEAATASLEQSLRRFPDAKVRTKAAWVHSQAAQINKILDLFYVLLALSVVVSLFGMINTLVLSVFERTRELGMLRAIGMTRIQVRRMVRQESVITALIGAALGLPLGIFLAGLVTRGLSSDGVGFHLPTGSLLVFAAVAVLAGVAAAVIPARHASRLDVLRALQYE